MDRFFKKPVDVFRQIRKRKIERWIFACLSVFLVTAIVAFLFMNKFSAKAEIIQEDQNLAYQANLRPTFKLQSNGLVKSSEDIKSLGEIQVGEKKVRAKAVLDGNPEESKDLEIAAVKDSTIFDISLPELNDFVPGRYKLNIEIESGHKTQTLEQDFLWGVLAINPDQSRYRTGQNANISMAVLDDYGRMVCDAEVQLSITAPDKSSTIKSTKDNTISISDECGEYRPTKLPDYFTNFDLLQAGTYDLKLVAKTANGVRETMDKIIVEDLPAVLIKREAATRIFPLDIYEVKIEVTAGTEFSGDFREKLPAGFEIIESNGASIETTELEHTLTWPANLKAGEKKTFSYKYDAPDVSPEFYLLGPAELGPLHDQDGQPTKSAVFAREDRAWQIASDALPTYVNPGAVAANAGSVAVGLPAGIVADDILLLFIETENEAVSVSSAGSCATWTEVANSPQGTGVASDTAATRLTAFWCRYGGSGTTGPTISDSGDHQLARIVAIHGAILSGDPVDVTSYGVEVGNSDNTGVIPGATTTGADRFVVAAIATALPDGTGTANFSSFANADLANFAERTDNTTNAGTGGGLSIATGEKATEGAYGDTTVTVGTNAAKAFMTVALKPTAPPTVNVDNPATDTDVAEGSTFDIQYDMADIDSVATADFFYETDGNGAGGTAIAACQDQAEGTDATCTFNPVTESMAFETYYYIYAVASDGVNNVTDVSSGRIRRVAPPSYNISGTVYTSDLSNATALGANLTVAISINGGSTLYTDDTDVNGQYIVSAPVTNNSVLTIYLSGETQKGSMVMKIGTAGNLTNNHFNQDYTKVNYLSGTEITNTIIGSGYNASYSSDMLFAFSTPNVTFAQGLYIPAAKTYRPAGTVTTGDLNISGTFSTEANAVTLSGNWSNSGTFTPGTGTVTFNKASGTQTLDSGGTAAGKTFNMLRINSATTQLVNNDVLFKQIYIVNGATFDPNGRTVTNDNYGTSMFNERPGFEIEGGGTYLGANNNLIFKNTIGGSNEIINYNAGNDFGHVTITTNTVYFSSVNFENAMIVSTLTISDNSTLNLQYNIPALLSNSEVLTITGSGTPVSIGSGGHLNGEIYDDRVSTRTVSNVAYTGTAGTNIAPADYYNLILQPASGSASYNLIEGSAEAKTIIRNNLNITANATLNTAGYDMDLVGANPLTVSGTLNTTGGGTTRYVSPGAATISALNYANLELAPCASWVAPSMGTPSMRGTYYYIGTHNGQPYYRTLSNSSDAYLYRATYGGHFYWRMGYSLQADGANPATDWYYGAQDTDLPGGTWSTGNGNLPVPTLTAGTSIPTYTLDTGTLTVLGNLVVGGGTAATVVGASVTAATSNPTINVNGNTTINSNATFVASASAAFSIASNYTNSGTFTDSGGLLTLDGQGSQTITAGGTDAAHDFNNLTITNASAAGVTFADSVTVVGTFTDTTANSKLIFTDGSTYAFSAININGSGSGKITMTTTGGAHGHWHFIVPGTPTVTYVTADHSDATGSGASIDATGNCIDGAGGGTNTYWTFPLSSTYDVNGTVYTSDLGNVANVGASKTVSISINGATISASDDTDANGYYDITGLTLNDNDILTLYLDDETENGSLIIQTGTKGNISSANFNQDWVKLKSLSGDVTNTTIDAADGCGDAEIGFSVSSSIATFSSGYGLYVPTATTYKPGNSLVAGGSARIAGTLDLENNTASVAGNWDATSGTFTNGGTSIVDFTATSTGKTITDGGNEWDFVTFSGSGGGWSFADSTVLSGDLDISAGTLSGTNSITVNGGDATGNGTIALTNGTFLLDGNGNFGGDSSWSFSSLTFGDTSGIATSTKTGTNQVSVFTLLKIATSQTLDADNDTWNLNGNTTSFTINGTFDEDVSTFRYAGGPTQYVTPTTYNNLIVDNIFGAFELNGDMTVKSTLTLTSGQLNLGTGTTTLLSTGSPISIGSGTLEPNGSTVIYSGVGDVSVAAVPYYNMYLKPTSDASAYAYSLPSGTLSVYNNVIIGDGTNPVIVTAATNNPIIDIAFQFSIDNSATFIASGSAGMSVGGEFFVNSTGTFTHSSNTVTLDGAGTQLVTMSGTGSGHTFNNLIAQNSETADGTILVAGDLAVDGNISVQTTNTGYKLFDCDTYDPNITLGGNLAFFKSSTGLAKLDMGDGTWAVAGDMDFRNATLNANGSTIVTLGLDKTLHGSNISLNNLQISNNTFTDDHWAGSISLSGTLTVDIGKYFYVGAGQTFRMNAGSSTVLNGDVAYGGGGAYISFIDSASANISGTGHLYTHSVFITETSDVTVAPRTFDSWLMFVNNDASNSSHTITLGTAAGQSFTSGLIKLQANYGGNLTIDGSINNPNMHFYGLTYDGIGTGTEYLKLGNGPWTSEGDVTFPAGTNTVVPGNSTFTFRYTGTFNPNGQTLHDFTYWASNPHKVTMAGDLHVNGNMVIDTNWETATFDNSINDNNITIDGDLSYGNTVPNKGALLMGDGTWKVGGSVNLGGMTVTPGSSTLELNGSVAQTLTTSGQSLYNLSVTNASVAGVTFADSATVTGTFTDVTASSKLTFDALSTYAFANININGQDAGTKITMVSNDPSNADLPSRQWYLNVSQSSPQASFVSVTDSDANGGNAIAVASSTSGGNNENWIFGINISGTVYTVEDKSNNIGAGKTVALSINGAAATEVETTTGGAFSISAEVSTNNTIAIFLSGEAEKASYITQAADSATDITGLELYTSHIILTYNTSGPMTNALLATADNVSDSDLLASVSGSDATFATDNEVWILGGKIYTPGGNVTMGSLDIISAATFNPETNTITFTDSGTPFSINGTFNGAAATVVYTGSSATSVTGTTYNNLTVNHTGTTFTSTGDSTVKSVFTIQAGTYNASDDTLTLSGSGTPFVNNGTFIESTSHVVYSGTGATNITGSTYNDLTLTNGGYYKALSITNEAGSTLTDYQIKVDLSASNFDFSQSTNDGRDIRFYDNDNSTALSFYINSWDQVGQTAVIWVKVPSISTSGTTVYLHFGDANLTSASSGDDTFMFFDDFSGSSLDTTKWPSHSGETVGSGAVTLNVSTDVAGGEDYIWATDYAVPIGSVVDIKNKSAAVNSRFRFGITDTRTTFYANSINYCGIQQFIDGNAYSDINAAGTLTQDFAATYDANWHNYSFVWASNLAKYYRDGTLLKSYTSNVPIASASMHPYFRDDGSVDSIWVRKYASTEPTFTAGQTLSSKVAAGSITARGVLNISQGVFDASDKTITLSGDATPFVIGGTFVSNTSTILYDGSPAVNVTNTTYYNLSFNCADATFTSLGNTTVNHVLNITSGTFDASDDSLVLAGSGTPMVVDGTFNPSTSTLTYLGSGVVNIAATSYYDLLLDNASGEFSGGSSAITVNNNITLAQGQFTSTSGILSVAGNWVRNSTFIHNSGTVDFTKDSGTQTLTQDYGSGDFYNLVHSGSGILQFSSDWSYYKEITVSHTVVTGSDQSSFPILVSLSSDADLAAAAQSDGDDIYFSDTLGQKLDHQIEKYVTASGELKAWVRIPTLSATNDTVIKMHYGNSGCASQQNIAAVWSNGFAGVWHMGEETNGQVLDSSGNANNSVAANTTQVSGQIGNSQSFDGSSQYVNLGGGSTLRPAKISVSAWVKTNGNQDGYDRIINIPYSTTDASWELSWNRSGSAGLIPYFGMRVGSSSQNGRLYNSSVTDNSWTYLTSTWDGSSSHNYINASASDGSLFNGSTSGDLYYEGTPQNAFVSTWKGSGSFGKYNGLDEIRVSSVARTADWIATEYKNQSDPTSYQTVGDETDSTIVIAGALTQSSSGTLDTNGFKVTVSGLATISGGEYLSASSEQILNGGLTISGGIYSGSTGATDVNGAVALSSGTLTAPSGAFTVSGDWTKSGGTFTTGSNSLIFDGGDSQTVTSGGASFNDLTVTNASVAGVTFADSATVTGTFTDVTASSKLTFDALSTYAFANININGQDAGTKITMVSNDPNNADLPSRQWYLNVSQSSPQASFVSVTDSDANGGNAIDPITSTDGGNNENWLFSTAPNAPTSLLQKKVTGGDTLSTGGWTNENQITFSATASDADTSDTLYLCVEKAVVATAFSSANGGDLCGSGVAYSGTPVTVSVTITGLADAAEFHWQAQVKDAAATYSSFVSYGSNTENPPTNPAARDFGVDTTAPTGGTVNDGVSGDQDVNDGTLNSISANWSGFDAAVSGLSKYEYALRRSSDNWYWNAAGASWQSDESWVDNGTTSSVTVAPAYLNTGENYYFAVKASDNAGNTATAVNSNGQQVAPTLSFSYDNAVINFSSLNNTNDWTDVKSTEISTSTNASNGYSVYGYITQLLTSLTNPSISIPNFSYNSASWSSPQTWPLGQYGFGYTSSDTVVSGSNRFAGGTKYSPFKLQADAPGDIVADHTDTVNGQTGAVTEEKFNVSYKVSASQYQSASDYQTFATYVVTANF